MGVEGHSLQREWHVQRHGLREELAFWKGAEKARGTEAQRTGGSDRGEFAEAGSRPCRTLGHHPRRSGESSKFSIRAVIICK